MKIVAIGGGNNSNIRKNGEPKIYEQESIDREIIRISGKKKPNVLYVSHASSPEYEEGSFNAIKNTYEKMYHCSVKLLSIDMLLKPEETDKLLDWSDIIYVGGGNTKQLIELWRGSGFDEKLIKASNDKVLCGISAGGGCWFKYTSSDYLQMETGNISAPFMPVKGIGLVGLIFNPHAGDHGRMKGIKNITELINLKGISLTDNIAIEIIDDEYKLIEGISSEGFAKEAIISYWDGTDYRIEPMEEKGLVSELIYGKKKTHQKRK